MKDASYQQFVKHWKDVMDLPPQTVGPLTPLYKNITRRLKVMPWLILVVGAIVLVVLLYYVFGSTITLLVSLLQRGF